MAGATASAKGLGLLLVVVAAASIGGCASEEDELPPDVWSRQSAAPPQVPRYLDDVGGCMNNYRGCSVVYPDAVGRAAAVDGNGCYRSSPRGRSIGMSRRPTYRFQRVAGADEPELGETLEVCPEGFNVATRPVTLSMRRSDGSTVSRRVRPNIESLGSDAVGVAAFFLDATWPLGRVVVTARQGHLRAQRAFRVVAPRHRGVRVQRWVGRPQLPNPMTIMVVGERPRSSVLVDLYRADRNRYVYATSFRILTDGRGVGQVRAPYSRAQNGAYRLRPRSAGATRDRDLEAHVPICIGCCQARPHQNAYCLN